MPYNGLYRASEASVVKTSRSERTFDIKWPGIDDVLRLDFDPLDRLLQSDAYPVVLVHWQARPKGARRWGVCALNNSPTRWEYVVADNVEIVCPTRTIQLDENKVKTVPTAVLVCEKSWYEIKRDGINTVVRVAKYGGGNV